MDEHCRATRPPTNKPNNLTYFHCGDCARTLPPGVARRDWMRFEIGVNPDGMVQVWCVRHNAFVIGFWPTDDCPPELPGKEEIYE